MTGRTQIEAYVLDKEDWDTYYRSLKTLDILRSLNLTNIETRSNQIKVIFDKDRLEILATLRQMESTICKLRKILEK